MGKLKKTVKKKKATSKALLVPSNTEAFSPFQRAYFSTPSQNNEGYLPDRGSFKAGWFACLNWLRARSGQ